MKKIETSIIINASADKVWSILMDFDNHPAWNPFMYAISGEQTVGKQLTVTFKKKGGKGMTFKPIILALKPNHEFCWTGKLGIKGIFDGEHYFLLEQVNNKKTNLIHGENFSGILTVFLSNMLEKTKIEFQKMNVGLKGYCERVI